MFIPRISSYQSVTRHTCYFAKTFHARYFANIRCHSPVDLSLYLVTHRSCVPNDPNDEIFTTKVLNAVKGGVSCVQIRDRDEDRDALIRTAKKLKCLLTPFHVPVIINDYVDIALAVEAGGVHLGQKDMPYHTARKVLGPHSIIGLSVDNWNDVIAAQDLDVDYLGVSQLFGSKTTKPDYKHPWGLDGLKKIREFSKHRLVPIGGIDSSNLSSICKILELGPDGDGVAMVGDLWRADNPYAIAKKVRSIMHKIEAVNEVCHV